MKTLFTALLSLALFTTMGQGTLINLDEFGLRFTVPTGWTHVIENDVIIMGHETLPGIMLAFQNDASNLAELKAVANQGIQDPNINLTPSSQFKTVGKHKLEGFYSGTFDGHFVKSFAVGVVNGKDLGITVLVITETDLFTDQHVSEAKKFGSGIQFVEAKESSQTSRWKRDLVGRQLKYLSSSSSSDYGGGYSGTSSRTNIKLFANGRFDYYSSNMASFDGSGGFGYANSRDANEGTYRIYSIGNESYLELHFDDDTYREYALSLNSEQNVLLNGTRFFLVSLEE